MSSHKREFFQNRSVLVSLVCDVNSALRRKKALEKIKLDWTKKTTERINFLNKPRTIWHAASRFKTVEGKASWRYVQDNPEVWNPEERGPFGETPLHIALLFNEPSEQLTNFFLEMWDMSSHEVRIAEYAAEPFTGENVLHIAIMKKVGLEIVKKIVESEKELLHGKVTGKFFKATELSGNSCNNLGEDALSFAACTNQLEIVQYLADLDAIHIETETSEGNNLLHLMVLNAFEDTPTPNNTDTDQKSDECQEIFREMFDDIVRIVKEKKTKQPDLLHQMLRHKNHDQQTPLALAAARGSVAMFNHLFAHTLTTAWVFGPVTCRKLCLAGIDYPSDSERAEASAGEAGTPECCILEILVRCRRKDILSQTAIENLVQLKWDHYGHALFREMLIKSVVFAILVFLMPMIECGSSLSSLLLHSAVRGAASLFYLRDYYAVCKTSVMYAPRQMQRALDIFVKRVFFEDFLWGLFRTLAAGSGSETGPAWGKTPGPALAAAAGEVDVATRRRELHGQVEALVQEAGRADLGWTTFYHATVPPCLFVLCARYVLSAWLAALGADLAAPRDGLLAGLWESALEGAHLFVSVMAFANVLYHFTCFERIGACILMIHRITLHDLPIFATIYVIFLFGCQCLLP